MPRKEKKYHFIYKTTNLLSGKYYLGMHSTDDLNDGYMGSGRRLRYSINKYGKENHKVEILEFLDSREELKKREEEIINLNEIAKEECMNLMVGGTGGAQSPEKQRNWIMAGSAGFVKKLREDAEFREVHRKTVSENMKKYLASGKHNHNTFEGRTHTNETKKKMSKSSKGQGKGKNNSQYGTCWVRMGKHGEEKKIKKEELNEYLSEGWERGRTLPKLVCNIGQRLKVKNDIVYEEDGFTIEANETCIVEDIKGYGFDIITDKDKIELRFMNSQILDYFELI